MRAPLRVLIAEDSPDDAELVLRALSEGGFDVTHKIVQEAGAFSEALEGERWHLVISDFRMPSFTGLEALSILRDRKIEVPFVIVSGTIGEETAVEAVKAGASDYVMKDRLMRLAPAVRRELEAVTNRARLREKEEQFRQAQKMESIGRLAGGIAHDFNNVLAVILMYCDMMLSRLSPEDYAARDIEQIRGAAERAATLTRQLLAFSRKQVLEPRVLDLNPVISNIEKMLRRLIGEDVKLTANQASGLRRVRIDPGQLEQVIMNLAVNSRDAMPKGGNLTIETANERVDEASPRWRNVPPGDYVRLTVSDTGTGMGAKTLASIFEPFFTTKEPGRGTGLGLATVHGIVSQSGGFVTVDSDLGRGTSFHVFLPALNVMPEPVAEARPPDAPGRDAMGKSVLLVEDESTLRAVLARTLQGQGFVVIEAASPAEAMVAISSGAKIDLLISDIRMPGSSGVDLALTLQKSNPGLGIILASGNLDEEIVGHPGLRERVFFLNKPFSLRQLTAKISEALQ